MDHMEPANVFYTDFSILQNSWLILLGGFRKEGRGEYLYVMVFALP